MKKVIALTLSLICILTLFIGCGERNKADVYFLNFKPESAAAYKEIAERYQA